MINPYHEWSRLQSSERVQKAWEDGKAKDTRKHKVGVAKRAASLTTIGAWLVRLIGGGAASGDRTGHAVW
jgi:hypothetical protein